MLKKFAVGVLASAPFWRSGLRVALRAPGRASRADRLRR